MKRILSFALLCLIVFSACKKKTLIIPEPAPVVVPPNQSTGAIKILSIYPTSGLPNTVVTITGTDFGTSASGMRVNFNGVEAAIKSVTPTEVKVLVPVTKTGDITMFLGNSIAAGPTFTYLNPALSVPYVSGNVTLSNQADVDLFTTLNKGRQLQIIGNLNIGGETYNGPTSNITSIDGLEDIVSVSGQLFLFKLELTKAKFLTKLTSVSNIVVYSGNFNDLDFSGLRSFTGSLTINDVPELTKVNINLQGNMQNLSISGCPKLADLSFLRHITSAKQLSLSGLAATSISMDQLTTVDGAMSISGNTSLSKLDFGSLTTASSSLTISYSPMLSKLNFPTLVSIGAKLILRSTGIDDMSGFGALESAGALQILGNASLTSFRGLEQLSRLGFPGIATSAVLGSSALSRANGIYIENNVKLVSLDGLQHIIDIPLVYMNSNPLLSDLCPCRQQLIALSKRPAYTYAYRNQLDRIINGSLAALTVTSTGGYANKQAAIDALARCK